jgi:hypothetical protein
MITGGWCDVPARKRHEAEVLRASVGSTKVTSDGLTGFGVVGPTRAKWGGSDSLFGMAVSSAVGLRGGAFRDWGIDND